MSAEVYPLAWPAGWPRTCVQKRSRFAVSTDLARRQLEAEIRRMGGRYIVISTNLPLRRDGNPYSNATEDEIEAAYRQRAKIVHPDVGGSDAAMAELNAARQEALLRRG